MPSARTVCALLLATAGVSALHASTLSYTGSFYDPNDVFLTTFTLASTGSLLVQTYGYGGTVDAPGGTNAAGQVIDSGGFDPYVTLFAGTGPGATFYASNDDGPCPPAHNSPYCEDSQLALAGLPAGDYTLALTTPGNFSFAENYGSGTQGDGFVGFGTFFDVRGLTNRTGDYEVDISSDALSGAPAGVTPEPASVALLSSGLLALAGVLRRQRTSR